MYVVDASVWVSRFVPSDAHHEPSRAWLRAQIDQGETIAAPALTLAEVAGAVARRTGLPELGARAVSLLQRLPNNTRLVPLDAQLAQLSASLAAELHLRGADAVYIALAQRLGVPLITWDQEQRDRGQHAVTALTP